MDDEWFIVYMLLEISRSIPEVAITVTDSDGQFLLIEAADHIDAWLGPENSQNRVWIRKGTLHVVPLDEPGRTPDGMEFEAGLRCMLRDGRTQASTAAHRAIFNRTTDVFPMKIRALQHTALCLVPEWLSLILSHPRMVGAAVNSFHTNTLEQIRKTAGKVALDSAAPNGKRLVLMPLHFTRAMYAQLTFKNFHPPRKFHSRMRQVSERAAQSSSSSSTGRKLLKAFDLGCRLVCGIECAYNSSRARWTALSEADRASSREWVHLALDSLLQQQGEGGEGGEATSAVQSEDFDALYDSVACDQSADDDDWLHMTPTDFEKEMQQRMARFSSDTPAPSSTGAPPSTPSTPSTKSTAPTTASINKGVSTKADVPDELLRGQEREQEREKEDLQSIVDGMKNFFKGSSGFEGVDDNRDDRTDTDHTDNTDDLKDAVGSSKHNSTSKRTSGSGSGSVAKESKGAQGAAKGAAKGAAGTAGLKGAGLGAGLDIDYDLLQSLLSTPAPAACGEDKEAANKETEEADDSFFSPEDAEDFYVNSDSDDSDDESEPETGARDHSTLGRASTIPDKPSEADQVSVDSDDETEGSEGEGDEDQMIKAYQEMMDNELFSESALAETFEWTERNGSGGGGGGKEVDMDMTLLKNLMESQAHGMGSMSGPLGHLMAQMGINVPLPPPMNK